MSLFNETPIKAVDVEPDLLLQDTYLLVIGLKQGGRVIDSQTLQDLCIEQINRVRKQLEGAHASSQSVALISHAQCALLDETVLVHGGPDARALWATEPLQARYFSRHQAGEFLYEEMRQVLREPSPDPHVLTVYHRLLMLGFRGRYKDLDHPERQQLLSELSARVAPLSVDQALPTAARAGQHNPIWRSFAMHSVIAVLVLTLVWWGLDQLLARQIAALATGQG